MSSFIVPVISAGPTFDGNAYPQETFTVQLPDIVFWWDGVSDVYLSGNRSEMIDFFVDDGLVIYGFPGGHYTQTAHGPAGPKPPERITPILTPGWNRIVIIVVNWLHLSISYGWNQTTDEFQNVFFNAIYPGDPIRIRPTDWFWSGFGPEPSV